jgi:indolepyruvate ferredoxin oxidoreductase
MERALIGEYLAMIDRVLNGLSADNYDRAVEVAELPDIIRGYESIKEGNIAQFREQAQRLLGP